MVVWVVFWRSDHPIVVLFISEHRFLDVGKKPERIHHVGRKRLPIFWDLIEDSWSLMVSLQLLSYMCIHMCVQKTKLISVVTKSSTFDKSLNMLPGYLMGSILLPL